MSDLKKLALKLGSEGPHKTLATPRKVQILFGGSYILRTTNAVYVWEHPYYPQFYVPFDELQKTVKQLGAQLTEVETFHSETDAKQALAAQYSLTLPQSGHEGGKSTSKILAFSADLPSNSPAAPLRNLVKIDFAAMDKWLEEDTPIMVHPKDPFKRIDILQSTREIRVSVDGVQIAHAKGFAMHLYETMLPCRFYLPFTAFDAAVLRPSEKRTKCPYKGEAEYYSVEVNGQLHEDLVWFYRNPTLESGAIVGLLCPYNERVDIELDGVKLERPETPFGPKKVVAKV